MTSAELNLGLLLDWSGHGYEQWDKLSFKAMFKG